VDTSGGCGGIGGKSEPVRARFDSAALLDGWIKTSTTPNPVLLKILLPGLHRGEAEAIDLALEMKAETVVIDEQEGRPIATQAGLSVTGVLGILLRAKQTGTISSVRAEIGPLRAKARFFIAPPLRQRSSRWLPSRETQRHQLRAIIAS
jgi:predicted nucleic acid-binding protein